MYLKQKIVDLFKDNWDDPFQGLELDNLQGRLLNLVGRFRQSDVGNQLCDWIEANIDSVQFDAQLNGAGMYYVDSNAMLIGALLEDDIVGRAIAHEARHGRHKQLGLYDTAGLSNDDKIFLMLVAEADAHSYTIAFCMQHALETGDNGFLDGLMKNAGYRFLIEQLWDTPKEQQKDMRHIRRVLFDAFFDKKNPRLNLYLDDDFQQSQSSRIAEPVTRTLNPKDFNHVGQSDDMSLHSGNFILDHNPHGLADDKYWKVLRAQKPRIVPKIPFRRGI